MDSEAQLSELTDVVLLPDGISLSCHKVVLSAFSPYFQAMFTCGLKETRGAEVPLRDVSAQSLELLLNFMYCAELPLSNTNIQGVAAAAFLLHMNHSLDVQSLGDLLASDDLNISQEEVVLQLVLHWVERRRNDSQSESKAVELLRRVRLELVDPGFLRKARRRNPTSALSDTSAPPRPPLRYGMETTDLLLCLGGVTAEGVPACRGGLANLSFALLLEAGRSITSPLPGAVTRDNVILEAVEAKDQHRVKRLDIYRCVLHPHSFFPIFVSKLLRM
uniref:BTB domain-containing protein n=1 Tax=Nothobranchius furzeri TaxID=105023 RepID=A0A8C6LJA1_NOTFU